MKRTNQLVAESAAIGFVLVLTVVGGSFVGLSRPSEWTLLTNPDVVAVKHDPNALSLYYNNTLSLLGEGDFANVSQALRTFSFVNVSPRVNQTALSANSEIASMNVSVPRAMLDLTASRQQIVADELVNATALVKSGCLQATAARSALAEFVNSTSPRLTSLGVPAEPYVVGEGLAQTEVFSLWSECLSLLDLLSHPNANLTIGSSQSTIVTGGPVSLVATLSKQGAGLPGQSVLFYLNGSYFGKVVTGAGGGAQRILSIPYVYKPLGVITAIVSRNESIGLQGAESNSLNFTILFTGTKIVIGDPSTYLPTFSFAVRGNLTTASGTPLPGAPVKITFFDESYYATTSPAGAFAANLTVPANTRDGTAYVYAAFAAKGTYGPSVNFTSIEVTHVPLKVTVNVPKLSLAGFTASVSGTLTASGTAVAGATVRVASPWGEFQTQSDGAGRYSFTLPVSISEFAPMQDVGVSATAPQPYIAPGQATAGVSLLNPILIVLPALGAGVTAYEFESLGLMPKLRRNFRRTKGTQTAEFATGSSVIASPVEPRAPTPQYSGIMLVYLEAVTIASRKLRIDFKESATMREMIGQVRKMDAAAATPFSNVLLATEDFLYSKAFDTRRLKVAQMGLTNLKGLWGE